MSDSNTVATGHRDPTIGNDAIPLDPPPEYEPKPEDDNSANVNAPHQLLTGQPAGSVNESGAQPAERVAHWKTLLVYGLIALLSYWLTISLLHSLTTPKNSVLYSSSYSNEYRFRPAASPVITETLADGRTRIHGAHPTSR